MKTERKIDEIEQSAKLFCNLLQIPNTPWHTESLTYLSTHTIAHTHTSFRDPHINQNHRKEGDNIVAVQNSRTPGAPDAVLSVCSRDVSSLRVFQLLNSKTKHSIK